jgi:hypothetical protein
VIGVVSEILVLRSFRFEIKRPADLYTASARCYDGLPELTYPFHDRNVTACGRLCLHREKINISAVLAGRKLGIKEVEDGIWLVSFMHYDLGHFDLEQPWSRKPCGPSTTRPARGCHPCLRYVLLPISPGRTQYLVVAGEGLEPPTPGL